MGWACVRWSGRGSDRSERAVGLVSSHSCPTGPPRWDAIVSAYAQAGYESRGADLGGDAKGLSRIETHS
jgi:hypothetical protein